MKISGDAWYQKIINRVPTRIAQEIERGWTFNTKQPHTKPKAKRKVKGGKRK